MIRDFLQAARLRTLPLASACVLTGGALAGATGNVGFIRFILFTGCLVTVFLLQVLANFANDLGDFENGPTAPRATKGRPRRRFGPHHGRQMKRAVLVTAGLAFATGVATVLLPWRCWLSPEVGGTGLASIAAAYAYTAGKRPYGYSGLGDISVRLLRLCGVAGTAALITGDFEPPLASAVRHHWPSQRGVLNLNNLRDHRSDAATGKQTWSSGWAFAGKVYHAALLIGAWVALLAFWVLDGADHGGHLWYGLFGLGSRPPPRLRVPDRGPGRARWRIEENRPEHLRHFPVPLPQRHRMTGLDIRIVERALQFKKPAGTSRAC